MKEETLKIDLIKVFLIYCLLGLVLGVTVILILNQVNPNSGSLIWILHYIVPINGLIGVYREKKHTKLKFSRKGLGIKGETIDWEDILLTLQFSSKLFGKSYLIESKSRKLHDQLHLNWWNEEELMRLVIVYTPEKHPLKKIMNQHEFGLTSQFSLPTKISTNGLWNLISFDYVFFALFCAGIIKVKYF